MNALLDKPESPPVSAPADRGLSRFELLIFIAALAILAAIWLA